MQTNVKILLIGGNGYIGNAILDKFHSNKIYIFDKKIRKKKLIIIIFLLKEI